MTELVIVRHAQSVWNAEGRWQGWADPPLSPWGEQQAAEAAQALAGGTGPLGRPDVLAASDLQRALRTAEVLGAGLAAAHGPAEGFAPSEILIDPDLREYDTGDWTGLRRSEIAARWPQQLEDWDAGRLGTIPGGEDPKAFADRLFAALERLRRAAPDRRVLAVSHGRAIHVVTDALGGSGGHVGHLTGRRLHLGRAPVLVSEVSLLGPPA